MNAKEFFWHQRKQRNAVRNVVIIKKNHEFHVPQLMPLTKILIGFCIKVMVESILKAFAANELNFSN